MSGWQSDARRVRLERLGWSGFFEAQVGDGEAELRPARIDGVHRDRLTGLVPDGRIEVGLPARSDTGAFAVGDWVLADARGAFSRRLERKSILQRPGEGRRPAQLVAANIDTLFIVTSCNADFNPARLERYLALANEAGTAPVIVLSKADVADDAAAYRRQAEALQRELPVVLVNGRSAKAAVALEPWCGAGATVALVGSSGVGKSTLVNALVGVAWTDPQQTGSVREGDAKGRHVTTARSLHPIAGGGWVIDTPGMRSLHVKDVPQGLDTLFAEIAELAPLCKFRDCTHDHEPGCAVLAAVAAGTVDAERLARWRKLQAESAGKRR